MLIIIFRAQDKFVCFDSLVEWTYWLILVQCSLYLYQCECQPITNKKSQCGNVKDVFGI